MDVVPVFSVPMCKYRITNSPSSGRFLPMELAALGISARQSTLARTEAGASQGRDSSSQAQMRCPMVQLIKSVQCLRIVQIGSGVVGVSCAMDRRGSVVAALDWHGYGWRRDRGRARAR